MVTNKEKIATLESYKSKCRDNRFREWLSNQIIDYRKLLLNEYPWSKKARERYEKRKGEAGLHEG